MEGKTKLGEEESEWRRGIYREVGVSGGGVRGGGLEG